MFDSIKTAISKTENTGSKNYLKLEPGNTYTVRLLPNTKNPEHTFLHYYTFGWNSFATGAFTRAVSPSTWNERCPIAEERFRIYKTGNDAEKEKIKAVRRTENWLVNVYVISDPVNPDNNGKVKLLRFGRQLNKVIQSAIEGEEAEDFGPRIFDLSPNGCSLLIKVEQQGDYPTYVSSKFRAPKEIEGLTPSEYQKIYDSVIDVTTCVQAKSYDEIKAMFDQHYHCIGVTPAAAAAAAAATAEKKNTTPAKVTEQPAPVDTGDAEIDKLLDTLNS